MGFAFGIAFLATLLLFAAGRTWFLSRFEPADVPDDVTASITPIEAAFLRAGACGVEEVQRAAAQCGQPLSGGGPRDVRLALATRGLIFGPNVGAAINLLRIFALGLALPAVFEFQAFLAARKPGGPNGKEIMAFALIYAIAAVLVYALTDVGRCTQRGRRALAARRAVYPATVVGITDPVEAVALYGGTLRPRRPDSDGSDGDLFWFAENGGGGHGHGDGHGAHGFSWADAGGFDGGGHGGGDGGGGH